MTIAIDAMVGHQPSPVVIESIALLASKPSDAHFLLLGNNTAILKQLEKHSFSAERITVVDCSDTIGLDENPKSAISQKLNASILKGLKLLAEKKVSVFCSLGNTSALALASLFALKPINTISKPAIGGFFHNLKGELSFLSDLGLNLDPNAEHIVANAELAYLYVKNYCQIEHPRVALLNVSNAPDAGSHLLKAAYERLSQHKLINFVGNITLEQAFHGLADVVILEGFLGFQFTQFADFISKVSQTDDFLQRLKPSYLAGNPILGVNGNVISGHPELDQEGVIKMIEMAIKQTHSEVILKTIQHYTT